MHRDSDTTYLKKSPFELIHITVYSMNAHNHIMFETKIGNLLLFFDWRQNKNGRRAIFLANFSCRMKRLNKKLTIPFLHSCHNRTGDKFYPGQTDPISILDYPILCSVIDVNMGWVKYQV